MYAHLLSDRTKMEPGSNSVQLNETLCYYMQLFSLRTKEYLALSHNHFGRIYSQCVECLKVYFITQYCL